MADWIRVCALDDIPVLGARVVHHGEDRLCVIRTAADEVFALDDRCPHKGGPLSQGIVHGRTVTCPLHGWAIDLASASAHAPDRGCVKAYPVKVEDGVVLLALEACSPVAAEDHRATADAEHASGEGGRP